MQENYTNQLLENLRKKKYTHLSPFIDKICGADLADMQWISKFNKGIWLLLCIIDIFSKYAWVIPLKDEKDITVTNGFQIFFDESQKNVGRQR